MKFEYNNFIPESYFEYVACIMAPILSVLIGIDELTRLLWVFILVDYR